jgi:hypothetical protein
MDISLMIQCHSDNGNLSIIDLTFKWSFNGQTKHLACTLTQQHKFNWHEWVVFSCLLSTWMGCLDANFIDFFELYWADMLMHNYNNINQGLKMSPRLCTFLPLLWNHIAIDLVISGTVVGIASYCNMPQYNI